MSAIIADLIVIAMTWRRIWPSILHVSMITKSSLVDAHPLFPTTSRQQPNPNSRKIATDNWTRLLLSYARHRKLFVLRAEDADVPNSEWEEVLSNPRISRGSTVICVRSSHFSSTDPPAS